MYNTKEHKFDGIYKAYYKSEIGTLEIKGGDQGILAISYVDKIYDFINVSPCLEECYAQIDEYFKGLRKEFSVKLMPHGTDFQRKVWNKLQEIPYGKTVAYLDIAESIENKNAVRAVGNANGKNVINIIIPCHRVIGSNGSLTGYGGGLWRKEWLLNHERKFSKY